MWRLSACTNCYLFPSFPALSQTASLPGLLFHSSGPQPPLPLPTAPFEPEFSVTARLLQTVETIAALRERIAAATVQVAWIPALQKDARVVGTLQARL